MTQQLHLDESQLDGLLDGDLEATERLDVERHLAACEACRDAYVRLAVTRDLLQAADDVDLPAGLERRLGDALTGDEHSARVAAQGNAFRLDHRPHRTASRWLLPIAATLLVAAAGVALWRVDGRVDVAKRPAPTAAPAPVLASDPVAAALADFDRLGDPTLLAALAVSDPAELARRWEAGEIGAPVRVIDLSMMGVPIIGGGAVELADRPAALALYQTPDGIIACWMFLAEDSELPAAIEEFDHRGFHFRVYEQEGVTLVAWREGQTVCALAGRGPSKDLRELAKAKAMA